jgi:hypothetical protein
LPASPLRCQSRRGAERETRLPSSLRKNSMRPSSRTGIGSFEGT